MKWVRAHCHVVDHPRFLEAGALARDLWNWGMLYSGKHELDGELPLGAILNTPWGAGGKKNAPIAERLVEVGLWEKTETGYRISKWEEMGNPTKAGLAAKREEERTGRANRRQNTKRSDPPPAVESGVVSAPDNVPDKERTPDGVPYSYSKSSGSGSREGVQGEDRPPWFDDAIATVEMQTGVKLRPADCWLRYFGHRRNKGVAPSHGDAVYWLTTVMVPEGRRELRAEADKRERDAKFDAERANRPSGFRQPETPPAPYHQVTKRKPANDADADRVSPAEAEEYAKKIAAGLF